MYARNSFIHHISAIRLLAVAALMLLPALCAVAQDVAETSPSGRWTPESAMPAPELRKEVPADSVPRDTVHRNLIQKLIHYISHTNDVRPEKKFDISVIGGPSYSAATSFEIAALVSGLYKSRSDSLTPRSDVTLYAQASVTGMYDFGIRGNHIFPGDRMRVVYDANFCHFPLKFWGIGYSEGADKNNETKYTLLQSSFDVKFLWKLPHNIFLGPSTDFDYYKATRARNLELWHGEDMRVFNYGFGVLFSLDTRDLATNASEGWYVGVHQKFFPAFMGNHYAFSSTDFSLMHYRRFWKSGVMAFRLHAAGAYGDVPWCQLQTIDNGYAMRGYYEGRYRDKNEADVVVELRQHLWGRNGIVVWGGVGSVFRRFDQVRWDTLLPSYGVGWRWEFKNKVNVRVDLGFGKHSMAIDFGINEAF